MKDKYVEFHATSSTSGKSKRSGKTISSICRYLKTILRNGSHYCLESLRILKLSIMTAYLIILSKCWLIDERILTIVKISWWMAILIFCMVSCWKSKLRIRKISIAYWLNCWILQSLLWIDPSSMRYTIRSIQKSCWSTSRRPWQLSYPRSSAKSDRDTRVFVIWDRRVTWTPFCSSSSW